MPRIAKISLVLFFVGSLSACERVKTQEAVAELPETSTADTLVLEADSVEIDTTLSEWSANQEERYRTSEDLTGATTGTAPDNTNGGTATVTEETKTTTATVTSPAKPAKRPTYVRPTAQQLQKALGRDAYLSSKMSLPRLKTYWLKRQHYYRRATKEVKFVSGDTKIKISPEETKIETPKGKVKIEGNDIKVKYD